MKMIDFAASLFPGFAKNRVITDARNTHEELKEITAPAFEHAMKIFTRRKLISPALLRLQDGFDAQHPRPSENMIVSIDKGMKEIIKNIKELEEVVQKTFNEEIAGAALSYRKANLLQLLEAYSFVSRYSRKLLNFAYVAETAAMEAKADGQTVDMEAARIGEEVLPADVDWLKQNMGYFSQLFVVCSGLGRHKDVVKTIEDIPDVEIVGGNHETMASTMGMDKVDPFRMGFIPVWLNPFYHIGMAVTEWQVARYNAAEEELRMLQLRKLKLEKRLDGKSDAKVEQQLEYMRKRVNDLEYKLIKMRGDD